jgi:hypothetical protein
LPIGPIHGPRHGARPGPRLGPAGSIFIEPTIGAARVTWTVDAASGIAVPASATEWTDFIAANGLSVAVPDHLWLCQETSGDLADSIGVVPMSVVNMSYQTAVTGWTRKGMGAVDGGVNYLSANTGAGQARTILMLTSIASTPAADRTVIYNNNAKVNYRSTALYRAGRHGGTMTDGTANHGTTVHPIVSRLVTSSMPDTMFFCSDLERIQVDETSTDSSVVYLGGVVEAAAPMRVLYVAEWEQSSAEMSNANVKALLQAMGWTVAWS